MSIHFHIFILFLDLEVLNCIPPQSCGPVNVSLFVCTAHRFASSKRLTRYASTTSCRVRREVSWNFNSPLCCWAISLTHCTNGSIQIRLPIIFFLNLQILQGHNAQPKSSLFCGEPSCLWVVPLPTFLLFSLLWSLSFSPLSGTLHCLPIFIPQMYYLLFMYSIAMTILLFVLFPPGYYNFELDSSKKCFIMRFVGHHIMYLKYIFIMYLHHFSTLSPFLISSVASFLKKLWRANTLHALNWIILLSILMSCLISLPPQSWSLTYTPPCMSHRRGRFCRSPSPRWAGSDDPPSLDHDYPMAQQEQNCTPP